MKAKQVEKRGRGRPKKENKKRLVGVMLEPNMISWLRASAKQQKISLSSFTQSVLAAAMPRNKS